MPADKHALPPTAGEEAIGWAEQLLEAAPDAMLVIGSDESISFANHQTEKLFGYPRAELLGQPLELLIPQRFRGSHHDHVKGFFARPSTRPMGSGLELFGRCKDGREIPVEVSLSVVRMRSEVSVCAAIRGIADRKRIEAELDQALRAAEAASAAKSEFLASMSHELRTPLNAILGFAQLLQRDKKEPLGGRHLERIDHILKGGEHLLRLIDDVLDLARVETGRVLISPEPVAVDAVLSEVVASLGPMAARAQVTLAIDPPPASLPKVIADRTRFKQVLMNYGSNAIKYGKAHGQARFATALHEGFVRVTLTDDGIGIAADKQDKLFQAFQRAGQETGPIEGTGIGLAITKRLAELMQGRVGFHSVEGQGSEFFIELPVQSADSTSVAAALGRAGQEQSALASAEGPRYSVVYIEDNPSNIAFMRDLLDAFERVELLTAPTAEIGVEIVRARKPHAVIMDIHLPGMNGFEATQRLRSWPETAAIPVVALSAAAMLHDAERMRDAGFYRYLTKPVRVDELTQVLEELLLRG